MENKDFAERNVGLVRALVPRFLGRGIEYDDLFQAGCEGLIKAAATECFKAWQDLAKYLELMDSLDSLPGASEAIDQLNAMNTVIKRRLEARKSNKAEGKEDDASVNIVELEDGSKFGVIQ